MHKVINASASSNYWQTEPNVTKLDNGGFLAVWQSYGQEGRLFGQRFDSSGRISGTEFPIISPTSDLYGAFPSVAILKRAVLS